MDVTRIELRHLRYFLAVAEQMHFTRAAAKLHVTQPTLSQQIRELEAQLNLPLFDRVGRLVKLTAAGETLLPHARRVVRELAEAQSALDELGGLKRGTLKVGIVQTINTCAVPEIVARFSTLHSGVRVGCAEMSVAEIEAELETGKLDLGISYLPPTRKSLNGQKLFAEELVAVMAADHPLADRQRMRIHELAHQPLALLTPQFCTRQLIDAAIAEAKVQAEVKVEMNSIDSILSTLKRTHLLSILPTIALCRRDSGLHTVMLTEPTPRRNVGLLWLATSSRRSAANAFAKVVQEVLLERIAEWKRTSSLPIKTVELA